MSNTLEKEKIMELVHLWQESPEKYTNLLIEQSYSVLHKLCNSEVTSKYWQNKNLDTTASSIAHEVFIKFTHKKCTSQFESYVEFNKHLREVVRTILLDKERKSNSQKRLLKNSGLGSEHIHSPDEQFNNIDVNVLDDFINQLRIKSPIAAEVISHRVYGAKTAKDIAFIMEKSIKTIEYQLNNAIKTLISMSNGLTLSY
jgi:hypothetical protein